MTRRTAVGSTTVRGYGNRHQLVRKRMAKQVDAGQSVCSRCGEPILPGQPWDADHADHVMAKAWGLYRGPSHRRCNRAANDRDRTQRHQQPGNGSQTHNDGVSHRRAADFFNT